jgi:polyferredoxin
MMVQIDTQPPRKSAGKPWYRSLLAVRHGVMLFFFLFLLHVAYDHQVKGGGPNGSPSIEAYCPFGGIENLYQSLTTGGYIRHIEPSAMIIMGALLVLTLLFSRGFCGWICPFGSIQEWIGLLGRRIFKKSYNPSGPWERRLRYLKYVILALIIGFTWHLGTLVFRPYDPFLAFFHLGEGLDEMPYAYAILAVTLLASLKYERFFCKYACPLGAVIGIVGKLGLTKVVRSDDGCKGCNICQEKCWANIDFLSTNTINDAECNHCLDCVVHCPKPNVLAMKAARWSFSHNTYAAALVLGLFAMIGISRVSGHWQTKPQMVAFTGTSGQLDAGQIRGWMSLNDLSQGYKIPLDRLYSDAKLPRSVKPDTRLNRIASEYKLAFEPDQMREIVTAALGHSAAPQRPNAPQRPAGKQDLSKSGKGGKSGNEDEQVKGFMTLNEVAMKTGVPKDYILKRLGAPANTDPRLPVREWIHAQGKTIQDVRDIVLDYQAGRK